MAKQSVVEAAIADLDRQIADLERAKEHIVSAVAFVQQALDSNEPTVPKVRKPRGPNKRKPGLPASETAANA